jgi:hypothetical protein
LGSLSTSAITFQILSKGADISRLVLIVIINLIVYATINV